MEMSLKLARVYKAEEQSEFKESLPNTVRAGTDSLFIQKETWAKMTVMMQGM